MRATNTTAQRTCIPLQKTSYRNSPRTAFKPDHAAHFKIHATTARPHNPSLPPAAVREPSRGRPRRSRKSEPPIPASQGRHNAAAAGLSDDAPRRGRDLRAMRRRRHRPPPRAHRGTCVQARITPVFVPPVIKPFNIARPGARPPASRGMRPAFFRSRGLLPERVLLRVAAAEGFPSRPIGGPPPIIRRGCFFARKPRRRDWARSRRARPRSLSRGRQRPDDAAL